MVGRLGHPNAGRLTTSALLKTNKVSAAAANGFFRIPYKTAFAADRVGTTDTMGSPRWYAATTLADNVGIAEPYLTFYVTIWGDLIDVVGVAEQGMTYPALALTMSEAAALSETYLAGRLYPQSVSDQPVITDLSAAAWHMLLSQGIRLTDTQIANMGYRIRETMRLLDRVATNVVFRPVLVDNTRFEEIVSLIPVVNATDGIGIAEVLKQAVGFALVEEVKAVDVMASQLKRVVLVAEFGGIKEAAVVGVPIALSDTIAISEAIKTVRAIRVIEQLGLAELYAPRTTYKQVASDAVRITDALRRFFGGDVVDGVAVSELSSAKRLADGQFSETVRVTDSTTSKFLLRAIAAETVNLTDVQVLKMLFRPSVTDGVELAAAYISPGGNSITTWAINTKNAAVTEYSNYEFNSFAHSGRKYLGASSSGVYELTGDDDAGTDIVAHIKSGFAQFGGSRFTSFKAAYLGMRGEGDFVLKVVAGDGKTYNYAVVAKDMQTTKVHMGKGLRARYFAFELISTGQDFDLDNIEFVPLVAQRRV